VANTQIPKHINISYTEKASRCWGFYPRFSLKGKNGYHYFNIPSRVASDAKHYPPSNSVLWVGTGTVSSVWVLRSEENEAIKRVIADTKDAENLRLWWTLNGHTRYREIDTSSSPAVGVGVLGSGYNCATWIGRIFPGKTCKPDFDPLKINEYAQALNEEKCYGPKIH